MVFTHIYTDVWSTVYSVLSRVLWKKSQAFYSGGIRTHDLCNSRAVSYQLDHRDCPVARGSLSPMFLAAGTANDLIDVKFANLTSEKLPLSQKLRCFRGSRFPQCVILSRALQCTYRKKTMEIWVQLVCAVARE